MTTVELKNILIHKISEIDDEPFLHAIKTILDAKAEATIYQTTEEQQARIQEARDQLARGETFTHEQVQNEINEWLKEK